MKKLAEKSKSNPWLSLLRLHTLPASISPVVLATAYALYTHHFALLPAFLCLLVAALAQTLSNVANDWFDYKRGADTEHRVGFDRPLSRGQLTERQVKATIIIILLLTLVCGLALLAVSSWYLVIVGLAIILAALAYTGGPFPLAYHGLGELAVFVFYGLVPTIFTYYVQSGTMDLDILLLGAAIGFSSVNILVVNNYRDYEEDKLSQKRTLFVRYGRDLAPRIYLASGLLSLMLLAPFYSAWGAILILGYTISFMRNYRALCSQEGAALNAVLKRTAIATFLLSLVAATLMLIK